MQASEPVPWRSMSTGVIWGALALGGPDLVANLARGHVSLPGALLVCGVQLCVGLPLAVLLIALARGAEAISMRPSSSLARVLYYITTTSFLMISVVQVRTTTLVPLTVLFVIAGTLLLSSWAFLRWCMPSNLLPYILGGLASCFIFHVAFGRVLEVIQGTADIDFMFILFASGTVGAHAFSFIIGALLANDRLPRLLVPGVVLLGVGLAFGPSILFPVQYPTFRSSCYILAFLALALALRGRMPDLPHLGKGAVLAAGLTTTALLVLHPLSSVLHYIARDSIICDSFIRESQILKFRLQRFVSALPAVAPTSPEDIRPATQAPGTKIDSILLITIDTLRYDYVGYSGSAPRALTPSIDRLASSSQRFHHAYAQAGVTALSLPALLWGKYPKDIEFDEVSRDDHRRSWKAPLHEPNANLAEILDAHGFRTIAVVNDGFSQLLKLETGVGRGFKKLVYTRDRAAEMSGREPTDTIAVDLAIEELSKLEHERFFLWLHLFEPHAPYKAPVGGFSGYASDIHRTDIEIGRLLDMLTSTVLLDHTLIVLTADHGEELGERGNHGHGMTVFEENIHIPLLVRVPHAPGADHTNEVQQIDIAPTILAFLGVEVPNTFHGRHLMQAVPERPIFTETWRYVSDAHNIAAIRNGKKIAYDALRGSLAVFDLMTDPRERSPIFIGDERYQPWVNEMIRALFDWRGTIDDH